MKSTEYLYGIDPRELENKFYFEALQYKHDACTKLFKELFLKHDRTEEEDVRLFHVGKAQGFTGKLLEERHYEPKQKRSTQKKETLKRKIMRLFGMR